MWYRTIYEFIYCLEKEENEKYAASETYCGGVNVVQKYWDGATIMLDMTARREENISRKNFLIHMRMDPENGKRFGSIDVLFEVLHKVLQTFDVGSGGR